MSSMFQLLLKLYTILFIFSFTAVNEIYSQASIIGRVLDQDGVGIAYVTCALYKTNAPELVKVESTNETGYFTFSNIIADSCRLVLTYVGMEELIIDSLFLDPKQKLDLGQLSLAPNNNALETVVVSAERSMIETKSDRVIFHVAGTINSTGDNAAQLLRKAPGVNMGANGAIKLLGREGVLFLVDGKPSPLQGEGLNDFLNNLSSDQIDRIELIHNPSVQYDAQGKAGIIDIKMVKDERHGFNSNVSLSLSQGRKTVVRQNTNINYKNKDFNVFGSLGYMHNASWSSLVLDGKLNGFGVKESLEYGILSKGFRVKYGFDYFLHPKHTLGILGSRINDTFDMEIDGSTEIGTTAFSSVDSLLLSKNLSNRERTIDNINLNYAFVDKAQKLSVDFDYGQYNTENDTDQPNSYYLSDGETFLSRSDKFYNSEIDINLLSVKVDYNKNLGKNNFSIGSKWSKVRTANTFLFYDIEDDQKLFNNSRSNLFDYDENIYAAYISYTRNFSEQINLTVGARAEQTYSTGDLNPVEAGIDLPPTERKYLNIFPNLSLSYEINPQKSFSFSYGRRINRPNYRRLNPFKSQVNEIGFSKGNPNLKPEIADNIELGLTVNRSYSFKLSYSRTKDKIVELIGPDDDSPIAGFLGYDNLATQDVISFNVSGPFSILEKIRVQNNVTLSYNDSNADYGNNIVIANDVFNFSVNQSYDYRINPKVSANVTAWYTSRDLWDGIQYSSDNYSLSAGMKWSMLDRRLSIQCNVNDIFFTERFKGESSFNGRTAEMLSLRDTRRVSLRMRYLLGNAKVRSRKRNTGNLDETKRT